MQQAAAGDAALSGIRVIDAATVYAGPLIAQQLADFGADVIKVEHPRRGDPMRTHGAIKSGEGLWWSIVARNKRTLGLYLGDPEAAAAFKELLRSADVLIENFRPGTLERWGLGWDVLHALNRRLVLVRVTGFGQTGPYRDRPGFGTLAEAMSGFAAMTGEPDGPPTLPPFGLADGVAGLAGAYATMLALYARDRDGGTGEGQVVDLSILEPLIAVLGPQATEYDALGIVAQRHGNRSTNNAPRNAYRTKDDKWVAVSASTTSIAERVVRLVGRADLAEHEWFHSGSGRASHADDIDEAVGGWIEQRTRDEVIEAFERADAAIAPVYDIADLVADEHVVERDIFARVEHPTLGSVLQPNLLFQLSATPGAIRHAGRGRGADTDAILDEAGIEPDRVAALRERGAVA